jgi:hypothetical protein
MSLKPFIDSGRAAIEQNNLYAGLSLALILPDMCGALEYPGASVTKRYEDWCRKWVQPKFTKGVNPFDGSPRIYVRAEDIYQLRCSLLHEGTSEIALHKRTGVDRFLIFDRTTNAHLTVFSDCDFNGEKVNLVQLKADLFSEEIFKAAEEWDASTVGNAEIQREKAKLLTIQTKGFRYGPVAFG